MSFFRSAWQFKLIPVNKSSIQEGNLIGVVWVRDDISGHIIIDPFRVCSKSSNHHLYNVASQGV